MFNPEFGVEDDIDDPDLRETRKSSTIPVVPLPLPISAMSDVWKSANARIQAKFREPSQRYEFSPIYENCDFVGKMRSRISNMNRSLRRIAPLDEIKYSRNVRETLTSQKKVRLLCDAVFQRDLITAENILMLGFSPNCFDYHGRPPLHIAVSRGYCDVVQLLLDYNADPNIKDGLGNTSLHLAACTNDVEMALLLIKGGASVHSTDIRGRSPIQLAQSKLRILRRNCNSINKNVVSKVLDLLLLYVEKTSDKTKNSEETEWLTNFQKRLQITDSPDQISVEVDNLSKLLSEMESLAID